MLILFDHTKHQKCLLSDSPWVNGHMRLLRLQRRRSFEVTCCAIQQRKLQPQRHRPARRSFLLGVAAFRRLLGTGLARPWASVNLRLCKRSSWNPHVHLRKNVLIHPKILMLTGWVGYFHGGWFWYTWPDSWSGARTRRGITSGCGSARFQARCTCLVSLLRRDQRKI